MGDKVTDRPSGWRSQKREPPRSTKAHREQRRTLLIRCHPPLTPLFARTYALASCLVEDTLKAFRRLLQRTPVYGAYKAIGHYPDYWYWVLRGRPARTPHLLKQKVVGEYGERFGLKTLVETGTYYGEMIAAVKRRFERIYSIEFDPALAERAQRKFARDAHVRIFCGNSRVVMPDVLALLNGPALFWLDAGYHGWVGKQGDQQRLSAELEMILSHPFPHVILVDDARGIRAVSDVKAYVDAKFPERRVKIEYDIVRVTPGGS